MSSVRQALLLAGVYLAVCVALCGVRPLWLDEVLQLMETRGRPTAEMIGRLPLTPGAAPLGYLVQQASLEAGGYSVLKARLPAALFGAATVYAVARLATGLGLGNGWLAGALFALFPLTVRYATEGRVYSQALFFSVLATHLFLRLERRPGWRVSGAYALALGAATYTQPYAVSVGAAHVLWCLLNRKECARWALAALAVAVVAFLPWYFWAKERWIAAVVHEALFFSGSARTPLMIFREAAGAGYWGSGLLLILCAFSVRRGVLNQSRRSFLLLLLGVPAACAFAADAIFGYFVAARQFLWILPAAAILAAAGMELGRRSAVLAGLLLAAVCLWHTVRFFSRPTEDWHVAAAELRRGVRVCPGLAVVPPEHIGLYRFFEPGLGSAPRQASCMMVAITPYSTPRQRRAAAASLEALGYRERGRIAAGGSTILEYRRLPGDLCPVASKTPIPLPGKPDRAPLRPTARRGG